MKKNQLIPTPPARIKTECVNGNAPECPQCKNWNALLDRFDYTGPDRDHYFECRDCGVVILATDLVVTMKQLDKPGMGSASTFTPVKDILGEDF